MKSSRTSSTETKEESFLNSEQRRLLNGRLDDLPSVSSKVIRIFLSSTFTDTQLERNALMEHAYQKLRKYCRKKHSIEFQVVDMRWGVTDETLDDHMTIEVCLNEIRNCQNASIGPNFMILLGMKYGYRPLPRVIEVGELEKLMTVISKDAEDLSLVNNWYMKDTNVMPPVYILLPVSTHLIYFNKKSLRTLFERDRRTWWKTLEQLVNILRRAATVLHAENQISSEQLHNYYMSVTEREVNCGVLNLEDPSKHCLVYLREIEGVEQAESDSVQDFIDVSSDSRQIDVDSQVLRLNLKAKLSKLKDGLQEYKLQWTGDKGIDPEGNDEHKKYLDQFTEHFISSIIRLIDESMMNSQKKLMMQIAFESVYNEVLQHLHACQNHCKIFHGQEATLTAISSYLQSSSNVPLVIHGKSGCGKTSIMAKAYSQVLQRSSSRTGDPVTIIRFLGTSPNSSLVISLIRNISQQIAVCYQQEAGKDSPTEMSMLIQHFNKMLTLANAERPLLLFLDSIDQLSTAYEARLLQWIPDRLPPHVKLVLTTLPVCEGDDLLEVLRKKFSSSSANFVEVGTLGENEGSVILESWLQEAGRKVTPEQQDEIDRVLQLCSLPLFLRLVFDQICRWRSFDLSLAVIAELSTTIHDSINALFSRLEVDYGQMFVSSTFAYVTLAKDGLSESELDDLLSLDDEVLNSVYQYHKPPIRRIPPLLWTRLRTQIPNYLTEREADGMNVISWYHRQFAEVARNRYLSNMNMTKRFHSMLADYFLGTWSGRSKPFRFTEEQRKMFGMMFNEMDSSADRLVADQPLAFLSDGKISSYNLRKLSLLPHHLVHAERFDDMEANVLLSFSWLHAKLTAMPLQTVFADFAELLAVRPDPEIRVILDSLRLAGCSLTRYPDVLGTQIVGRLLPYYHTHSKIKRLIDQCQTEGIKANALVPVNHCNHTPGGPLLCSLVRHSGVPFGIAVTSDKRYLISVSRICIVWDIRLGDVWRTIEPPIRGFMQGLALSADDAHAVCYTNPGNQIVVIHPLSGHYYNVDNPLADAASSNLLGLRCDDGHVLVWSTSCWAVIDMSGKTCAVGDFLHANFNIAEMFMTPRATKPIAKITSANPVAHVIRAVGFDFEDFHFTGSMALTKDRRSVFVCSSDGSQHDKAGLTGVGSVVVLYSADERVWSKQRTVGESPYAVNSLTLSDDESWLVASVKPGFLLWQTEGNGSQTERTLLGLSKGKTNYPGMKNSCVFSRHNKYLMASCGKTIFVYSVRRRQLLKEINAHFDRIKDIVAVSTDRLNIAISSSSDRTIKIWNFDNITKPLPEPAQHDKEIDSIAVSGRCERAVCVMRDSLGVWNTADGSLEKTLEVAALKATNAPAGVVIRMNCAAISNSGTFVIGADTQKMMIWETDGGGILHVHYFALEKDTIRHKEPVQLLLTDDDSRVLVILRTKANLLTPDLPLKGLCVCVKITTREVAYEAEFSCKNHCPAVLTSNNLYLVIPIHVDKTGFAKLGVWHVNIGIFLYEIAIDHLKASPIIDLVAQRHAPSLIAVVDGSKASLVEINRKLWKNSADCHIGSFVNWNGRSTSDGKFGVRKSVDGMSLQMFNLSTDRTVRTLYTGQHPGDINGSIFLTKNDKHAVYYQARDNVVRVFRFGSELVRDPDLVPAVGVLYPEARLCGLEDTADGMKLVAGLSDGRMVVYVIADPALKTNVDKLAECRRFVEHNTKASKLNVENGVRKNSRWTNVLNIARITSKAMVSTRSNSKVCSLQ